MSKFYKAMLSSLLFTGLFSASLYAVPTPEDEKLNLLQVGDSLSLEFSQDVLADANDLGLDKGDEDYYTIESITVTRLEDQDLIVDNKFDPASLGQVIMSFERLIAFGKQVWEIVDAGRPVMNNDYMQPISVLPNNEDGQATFYSISGWSVPRAQTYRVEYKNGLGMTVISFDYTVSFQYDGQFEGKGAYLTGVDVSASNVAVSWGFSFNANSQLVTISNRGTLEDPIAGATLQINFNSSSVLREINSSERFHVSGNGELHHLR